MVLPRSLKLGLLAGVVAIPLVSTAMAAPKVVASIKPVHSLLSGVMAGVAEPYLLIKGGASPHTYSLRPSDAKALQESAAVFWVGEGLETFLADKLPTLAPKAQHVELSEAEGLKILPYRHKDHDEEHHEEGHHEEAHHDEDTHGEHHTDHHGEGEAAEEHHHDHNGADLHLWLDPQRSQVLVRAMVQSLSKVDPDHASAYKRNGEAVTARLQALDTAMTQALQPVQAKPFITFHDAYQYLEQRYGLTQVGSVTMSPERQPGAEHLRQIKAAIKESGAVCAFAEPQFRPKLLKTVTAGTATQIGTLDPVGADLKPGPDLYFDLMQGNLKALTDCLGSGS